MSAPTWRFAVCRVMDHRRRFAPRALPCARRTRCTSSSACTRSSGTGMARQWVLRRFRVASRTSFALRSTSHARRPSASETRHPVIARVRARVWTAGLGRARATARKRSRSSFVRYFRPRASARVDELAHHRPSPSRPSDPERYISVWERTTPPSRPPRSAARSPAIPARPRPRAVRKCSRMSIREHLCGISGVVARWWV